MLGSLIVLTKTFTPDSIAYVGSDQVRFHQSLHFRPRQIENHRFLFVESGCGEFLFADETLSIDGRTLLLLSPGPRETRYRDTEPVSYTYVEFKSHFKLIDTSFVSYAESSPHFQTLVCLLRSIVINKGASAGQLISAAIELARLHPAHSGSAPESDARIQHVLDYIDLHLNHPLRVAELAREAGLSEPQFRRVFRKAMSIGPKEHLLQERMNYARRILQSEGLRVGEVADLLQFETVYQFSNQYKKVHGHSPTQDSSFRR
jgi:AraC-like DNA-binding protein